MTAEQVLPPSNPTVDDMETGLEIAAKTPGVYLRTQGDCNFAARFAERERQLASTLLEISDLEGFIKLAEHKLDQRLQGQYTNEQILGMLLKLARNLMVKHSISAIK